jgi:hypothetical protein
MMNADRCEGKQYSVFRIILTFFLAGLNEITETSVKIM